MPFVTDPIGIIGEAEAAKMLEKKGFKVVEHNWRMGHLEIDLIAESKKEIVFAEVKARTTTFGDKTPEEYVDEDKKRRMIAAGNAYIKHNRINKNLRFDISGILWNRATNKAEEIHYYEDAFRPKLRSVHTNSYNGQWKWHRR